MAHTGEEAHTSRVLIKSSLPRYQYEGKGLAAGWALFHVCSFISAAGVSLIAARLSRSC